MNNTYIREAKEVLFKKWDELAKKLSLPPLPLPSLDRLPADARGCVLEVPQFEQLDGFSCGFVAGWTVIKTIYPERNFKDGRSFYASCNPDVEMGTSTYKLVKALRAHGIRVGLRSGAIAFSLFKKALEDGCPLIADIDCPDTDYRHWVTVYGYSEGKRSGKKVRSLYLHNNGLPLLGRREKRIMDFEVFQKLQTGGVCLICRRRA
jgi:hypothetical protein